MASVAESMDQIIYVGIGIFVLVLIMSLSYQGYATSANVIQQSSCIAGRADCLGANQLNGGVYTNYTKYAGPLPNTFGGALQLAVFALVFIAIILAIVGALRGGGGTGTSGGFLR